MLIASRAFQSTTMFTPEMSRRKSMASTRATLSSLAAGRRLFRSDRASPAANAGAADSNEKITAKTQRAQRKRQEDQYFVFAVSSRSSRLRGSIFLRIRRLFRLLAERLAGVRIKPHLRGGRLIYGLPGVR